MEEKNLKEDNECSCGPMHGWWRDRICKHCGRRHFPLIRLIIAIIIICVIFSIGVKVGQLTNYGRYGMYYGPYGYGYPMMGGQGNYGVPNMMNPYGYYGNQQQVPTTAPNTSK
jgi:hypothetical protein